MKKTCKPNKTLKKAPYWGFFRLKRFPRNNLHHSKNISIFVEMKAKYYLTFGNNLVSLY